jgi:hypothetical protein
MMAGMKAKEKVAVSVPADLVDAARAAVDRGTDASVSAYFTRALDEQAKSDDLEALIVGMLDETGGPMTDEERTDIDCEAGWQ